MTTYEPGSYRKGEDVRAAHTKADAVALVFQGYALESTQDEAPEEYTTEPMVPDAESDEPESYLDAADPEFPEPTSPLGEEDLYVSGDNTGKEPWS